VKLLTRTTGLPWLHRDWQCLDFKEKVRRWLEERGQRKVFSRETVIKKLFLPKRSIGLYKMRNLRKKYPSLHVRYLSSKVVEE
jgi:hypothetical protein